MEEEPDDESMQETEKFVMDHVRAQRGTDNGYHGNKGWAFGSVNCICKEVGIGKTNPLNRVMLIFFLKTPWCCIDCLFVRARLT